MREIVWRADAILRAHDRETSWLCYVVASLLGAKKIKPQDFSKFPDMQSKKDMTRGQKEKWIVDMSEQLPSKQSNEQVMNRWSKLKWPQV